MNRTYIDYIADIYDAIEKIEQFIAGMDYDAFVRDGKTTYAVIRALEIIGEATKKLPDEFKTKHKQIPWTEMTGMRNKLIHEYFGVDVRVLWKTNTEDIPSIAPTMKEIAKQIKP